MQGEFFINNRDAYLTWGIFLDSSALSELFSFPPAKEHISNSSRLLDGKQVVLNNPKLDSRNVSLTLNMVAESKEEFFSNYLSFCEELKKDYLELKTKYQPDTVYRMYYLSCKQFTEYLLEGAKFILSLNEPDPSNRSL